MSTVERHVPVQQRSRERRARLLEATAELVASGGYDAVSTRAVSEHAGIPVATLYRYFADKDDLVAALVEHHVAAMDARTATLAERSYASLTEVVTALFGEHVDYFDHAPSWVEMWFRGRRSPAVTSVVHERNERLAVTLLAFGSARGLIDADTPLTPVLVAIEAADRVFELAYRTDPAGDRNVLAAGLEMITSYVTQLASA